MKLGVPFLIASSIALGAIGATAVEVISAQNIAKSSTLAKLPPVKRNTPEPKK